MRWRISLPHEVNGVTRKWTPKYGCLYLDCSVCFYLSKETLRSILDRMEGTPGSELVRFEMNYLEDKSTTWTFVNKEGNDMERLPYKEWQKELGRKKKSASSSQRTG